MNITKNSFLSILSVVVLTLLCVVALQHYVRASIIEQHLHSRHQLGQLLLDSLDIQSPERVKQQLQTRLESLPGWLAAVYDKSGKLVWQSQSETTGLDLTNIKQAQLAAPWFVVEQDWLISQHPLPSRSTGQHDLTVTLFSSRQAQQQQTSLLGNLIFATAMVVGLLIWWVIRLNSHYIRSDIRNYLRTNRKEFPHDNLTGLPTREILLDRIEHGLAQAMRKQLHVGLIYIGLDGFSKINETFGHAYGDQVLRSVSTRLTSASRESDTLVRIEADQFALLMTDINYQEEIEAVTRRIMQALTAPVEAGNKQCVITASVGISTDEHIEHDHDRLILNAYTAMLDVKQNTNGNHYQFFAPEMSLQYMAEAEKDAELYKAMENEEFCLFYQPKVDAVTGAIKGMEALIRWQHPERGMVSPVEFIPALEKSGLIVLVGEWVLREACRVNKAWQNEGLPPLKVSVNVATPQFKQEGFVEMVKEILDSSGLDPAYLEIEVTESCLMDDDTSNIDILDQIKAMGVAISVDDFGTGYSSLSYLKRFPIDTLKIDRSFITNVQDRKTNDNAAIVTAIMALSHSLRLEVVAEGVETPQELAYLHALGCRTIQGFLFSRPVSQEEFRALQQDSVSLKQTLETVREALR